MNPIDAIERLTVGTPYIQPKELTRVVQHKDPLVQLLAKCLIGAREQLMGMRSRITQLENEVRALEFQNEQLRNDKEDVL